MNKLNIFFRLTKIDEAKRLVSGIATAEQPDKTGEVCDYEGTKPYYQKWSDGFKKATDGASLGNLRAMHDNIAAGKIVDIVFNDALKTIEITAKVVDDDCWKKCLECVFTGFSQGGEYIKKWKQGDLTYYVADPAEISLVDNPCLGAATMQIVKADGQLELKKLRSVEEKPAMIKQPVQKWLADDGSTHDKKELALAKNVELAAQAEAAALVSDIKKVVGDANDALDKHDSKEDKPDADKPDVSTESEAKKNMDTELSLETAIGIFVMEKAGMHADHLAALGSIHKSSFDIMDHVHKCMHGAPADGVMKAEHHTEADKQHVEAIHSGASDIADKCMKMVGEGSPMMSAGNKTHVNDIHKSATCVMDAAHKFLHADKAMHHTANDRSQLHKMHSNAHDISEKCVKMFGEGDRQEGVHQFGEDDPITKLAGGEVAEKLAKAEALNSELKKSLSDVNVMVGDLTKRLEHIEKQPVALKGALFAIDREGSHEVQKSGTEPVETSPRTTLNALRLSPEEQRSALIGLYTH